MSAAARCSDMNWPTVVYPMVHPSRVWMTTVCGTSIANGRHTMKCVRQSKYQRLPKGVARLSGPQSLARVQLYVSSPSARSTSLRPGWSLKLTFQYSMMYTARYTLCSRRYGTKRKAMTERRRCGVSSAFLKPAMMTRAGTENIETMLCRTHASLAPADANGWTKFPATMHATSRNCARSRRWWSDSGVIPSRVKKPTKESGLEAAAANAGLLFAVGDMPGIAP
mmetsp:Transcript_15932/g.39154  ORF Transcript_15932/g.39154 Transcript_15932/m.39154 type:complete len:224 (-) Transcript_15932:48-719(-)